MNPHQKFEVLVVVFVVLIPVAMAVEYIVGGAAGWDFVPTASYYSDWAMENHFVVGDKLNFRYDPATHNVQEVSLNDYATCNTLDPVMQYQSGNDVITLPKPRTYYFICGFVGHCDGGGMLMKVVVAQGSGSSSPTPSRPPPNHPPPSPPPPNHPPPSPSLPPPNLPPPPPNLHPPPPNHPPHSPPPPPSNSPPPPPPQAQAFNSTPPPQVWPPPPSIDISPPPLPIQVPISLPSSPSSPPSPTHIFQNTTSNSSAAAVPPAPSAPVPPPPSNNTAPEPSEYDPDTANARHIGMNMVFTGLVIASAVIF